MINFDKIIRSACGLYILLVVFSLACCQRPMGNGQKAHHHEEMKFMQGLQDGTDVFFLLENQKIIADQKNIPHNFYIKGVIEGGEFHPKSEVLGVGDLAREGRYGWLELNSGEFFPMESDKKAITPFVKGFMTNQGFKPSSREVYSEP